jgi:hypothetical protein
MHRDPKPLAGLPGPSGRPITRPDAAVAQPVEHRIRNAGVVGSNPIRGTSFPIVRIIADCI